MSLNASLDPLPPGAPEPGSDSSASRGSWTRLGTETSTLWDAGLFLLTLVLVVKWSSGFRNALVWGSFAVLLARPELRPVSLKRSPILISAVLFLAWALVSVLVSQNPELSARDWIKTAESVVAAWVVAQLLWEPRKLDRTLWHLLLALTVIYVADAGWYVGHLGQDWHWGQRWESPPRFLHPNIFSGLIVATLPLALLPFLDGPPRPWRYATAILNALASLFLLDVFASRTAQVALVIALGCLIALRSKPHQRLLGAALMVLVIATAPFVNPRFTDSSIGTFSNRFENWVGTTELIAERPLVGHGFGDRNYFQVYGERFPDRSEPFPHPHNAFLRVSFSSGLIGLALFLALQIALTSGLWRCTRHLPSATERSLALVLLLSQIVLLTFSLGDVPTGPLHLYSWFLVAAGAALSSRLVTARSDELAVPPAAAPEPQRLRHQA
jgi:O-antigen ligase